MNVQLLITALVRQTTVLVAQLATSDGARSPLAHVANQVFFDLAAELENQGVGRKVAADMFGLALRSYQRKVQRISESSTDRGRTLWEAVLDFITKKGTIGRAEVLRRFHRDDEALVRGVLHDLTESGLVMRAGNDEGVEYRLATPEDLEVMRRADQGLGNDTMVWATVFRHGPATRDELRKLLSMPEPEFETSMLRLLADGRVRSARIAGVERISCTEFAVPLGQSFGWEAAVYDHFHAMVKTVCAKLAGENRVPSMADSVGGSTWSFDVWSGHPLEREVYETLRRVRQQMADLRSQVDAHNAAAGLPAEYHNVVFYAGQSVLPRESGDSDNQPTGPARGKS